jgi:hypothetical protein
MACGFISRVRTEAPGADKRERTILVVSCFVNLERARRVCSDVLFPIADQPRHMTNALHQHLESANTFVRQAHA